MYLRNKDNRIQVLRCVFAQRTGLCTASNIVPAEVYVDLNTHAVFPVIATAIWFTLVPVGVVKCLHFATWESPYVRTTAVAFDQLLTACPIRESRASCSVRIASRVI